MHASFITGFYTDLGEEGTDGIVDFAIPTNATTGRAGDGGFNTGIKTGDRAEVARFALPDPGPDPQMRMKRGMTLDIAFSGEGRTFGLDHLHGIWNEVSVIYRLFEPEFV